MAKLPKYMLNHDTKKDEWQLRHEGTKKVVESFDTKAEATKGGALAGALGPEGGSVRIQKLDGKIQEERTYPRSADPRDSKG